MSSGMNGVLVKPLRIKDLQQILFLWSPDALPAVAAQRSEQSEDLWTLFVEHNERDYHKAVLAIQNTQWSSASQHLHRIYGAALTMRQPELAELARGLEDMLLQGITEGLAERMERLRALLDRLAGG